MQLAKPRAMWTRSFSLRAKPLWCALIARIVALERDWPEDWLNDGAKGFLVRLSAGAVVFSAPGIEVHSPATAQLLAMKLSAWRDDVDIADARRLLQEMSGERDEIWRAVEIYLVPGNELKAHYAFADLWELLHGDAGTIG